MKITRRVQLALFAVFATIMANSPATAQQKPNIVVIMGDDIGMWNIGAYHRGLMAGRTPNLDKIAKEGMLFTDYYAEASCTAGRANFITGELPIRTGMTTVGQAGASIGLPAEAVTIATVLKSMGYATGQFGKNHLGDKNEFLPTVHGFDEFFGYLYHLDAMEDPAHPNYPQNLLNVVGPRNMVHSWATDTDNPTEMPRWGKIGKQRIEDAGTLYPKRMETVDDEIRDFALKFMDKAKADGKPFFVWLNPTRMHIVTHLSPKYEAMRNAENGWSEEEAGMAQLDDDVGLVMKKLKDMGVDDNTIVLFTTDNGTATKMATVFRQVERNRTCASTMVVTKSMELERMLLHSCATSTERPGIVSTNPSCETGTPAALNSQWAERAEPCCSRFMTVANADCGQGTSQNRKHSGKIKALATWDPRQRVHAPIQKRTSASMRQESCTSGSTTPSRATVKAATITDARISADPMP